LGLEASIGLDLTWAEDFEQDDLAVKPSYFTVLHAHYAGHEGRADTGTKVTMSTRKMSKDQIHQMIGLFQSYTPIRELP